MTKSDHSSRLVGHWPTTATELAAKGSLAQYEQIIPICCLNNTVSGQPMEYSSEVQRGSGRYPFGPESPSREPLEQA
jgi:hypothetical protein